MRTVQKYFMFNKEIDFRAGTLENLILSQKGITLEQGKSAGSFFSPLLDSREKKTTWNQMEIWTKEETETYEIEVWIYASEEKDCYLNGKFLPIERILKSREITAKEKEELFGTFLKKKGGGTEILLHGIEARFLWFEFRFMRKSNVFVAKIKIVFPKESWAEYLPDVYQQDKKSYSFIERYLGIFQSLYEEMSRKIREVSCHFDPEVTSPEYLFYLAEWVGLQDSFLWNTKKLRYLTAHAVKFYRQRGTTCYLENLLEIYIGKRPFIVENHQVSPFMTDSKKRELLKRLYGDSSYIFTVIIDSDTGMDKKDIPIIDRIIENEKPAHMESRIVILEPYIFLGWHSYLGMNSILSDFHSMLLDGRASIPFIRLQGE